jgi:hypothetical protein
MVWLMRGAEKTSCLEAVFFVFKETIGDFWGVVATLGLPFFQLGFLL